jgi:hypothetical protein
MSLGRISGPLLQANLQRNTDLAVETNLLYIGHTDGKIGIKTVTRPRDFTIDGTAKFRNATAGQPDLFLNNSLNLGNLTVSTNGIDSLTGSIFLNSAQDITVGGLGTEHIKIDGNAISTYNTNSNIDIRPNGAGTNEIVTAGKTVTVDGNTHATGNITFDGSVIIAGTGDEDNFTINADIVGDLIPDVDNTYELGTTAKRMSLYAEEITTNNVFTDNLIYQGINLTLRVGNIYVATNGLDTNAGDTVQGPFRTIQKALSIATAGQVINIEPGEYEEVFPLQVPAGVTIKGRDLRNCIIKPTAATNDKDCFLLDGETTVTDITIKDFYYNSTDNTGYAFRFRSGAKVTSRSPYIMNVTVITQGTSITTPTASSTFGVNAQETNPRGITFNNDGTKMFIVGTTGADVNEYTLSTGFDLSSTVTFVDSFSVSAKESGPTAVKFNTDGTKMFITGVSSSNVHEYALSTGFDVSTASFTQTLVTTVDNDNFGLDFSADGTKMYITGNQTDKIYEYNLSSAFDISTATFNQDKYLNAIDDEPFGIEFNTDGTRLFIVGTKGNGVDEYTLSTPYDISTMEHMGFFFIGGNPSGIHINPAGTKMFIMGNQSDLVKSYDLGTSYRVSQDNDPRGFAQGDAGKGVYVDGEVCDHDTNEASMLFHAATFITPGVDALTMTNGVRVEWLNCFTYFANRGIYALNGPGRWRSDSILVKGAEIRSIGSACVYGNIGAEADGANCLMYLIQHNMAYVGAGKEVTNDKTLINQANEVIEANSGNVYYQTVDQSGNFRVGDDFFIDFEKGTTSIDTSSIAGGLTSLKITTGGQETFLDGSKIQTGNIRVVSPNKITSITGDITFNSITGTHNIPTSVTAPNITTGGNVTLAGSLIKFGDAPGDTIDFNTPFAQDIKPNQHMTYNLGSATKRWLNSNLSQALVDDFRIYDNVIEQTSTNANIELNPQGAGKVIFDDITADGNTIASTNNQDIRLNATKFTITATGSVELPTGTTAQRKNTLADFRYNTQYGEFEGNNGGTVYFPTMRDSDRDTYINLNDNQFRFVTDGQQNTLLNQHILQTNKFTSDNKFSIDGNTITSATPDADINFFANGTGGIPFEDIEFKGQTVTNKLNTPFTFGLADVYSYLKFDNPYGLVIPNGVDANRPTSPEIGTTRWNQDKGYLETWNGTQWVLAAGGGASVTQEYAEDINFLWATLLG